MIVNLGSGPYEKIAQQRWERFQGWCKARGIDLDVASVDEVLILAFLESELRGAPLTTARLYTDAIQTALRRAGRPAPHLEDAEINEALGRATALVQRPEAAAGRPAPVPLVPTTIRRRKKKRAVDDGERTRSEPLRLPKMLIEARNEAIWRLRRALGAGQRKKLAVLLAEEIVWDPEGIVVLGRMIPGREVARALERWVSLGGISTGPLWRRVDPNGNLGSSMTLAEVVAAKRA